MKLLTLTRENGELQAFVADHIVTFWPETHVGTYISTGGGTWYVTENFMTVKRMMEDTK